MTLAVKHSKVLANPDTGVEDKVYGADYVSPTSHTLTGTPNRLVGLDANGNGTDDPSTLSPTFQSLTLSGLTSGSVVFAGAAGVLSQDNTNFNYTTTSGPRFQVGSGSTTVTGLVLGHGDASAAAGIWEQVFAGTPSINNAIVYTNGAGGVIFQSPAAADLLLRIAGTEKGRFVATAGAGLTISGGTATTDVAALSVTRTNNNAAVATGVKFAFTDGTSAASFRPLQVLGGASATTDLLVVGKTGDLSVAGSFVSGAAGGANSCVQIAPKAVSGFSNGVAKSVLTFTIPAGAHSGDFLIRVDGTLGAGEANGSTQNATHIVNITRLSGAVAAREIGAVIGQPAAAVSGGGASITTVVAVSAVSGAAGATNTFTVDVTLTRSGGTSDNHTAVVTCSLLNANATGITVL